MLAGRTRFGPCGATTSKTRRASYLSSTAMTGSLDAYKAVDGGYVDGEEGQGPDDGVKGRAGEDARGGRTEGRSAPGPGKQENHKFRTILCNNKDGLIHLSKSQKQN